MTTKLVAAGPQYSSVALQRTHQPPPRAFDAYRDCLRLDFKSICAYCLSTEREAAPGEAYGGFEIEHFRPKGRARFAGLRNEYRNLLWTCHACNRAKAQKWPTKQDRAVGGRFVDPSKEALGRFVCIRGDQVEPVSGSPAGAYMIDEINLNSAKHRERRRERAQRATLVAQLEGSCEAIRSRLRADAPPEARDEIARLEKQIAELKMMLDRDGMLSDAPTSCLCPTRGG